ATWPSISISAEPFRVSPDYLALIEDRFFHLEERSRAVDSTFGVLDAIAFAVFAVLIAVTIVIIVFLGQLPGRLARQRGHAQAAAINVAGWLGVATLGLLWPLALVWAFVTPTPTAARPQRSREVHSSEERRSPMSGPSTIKQVRP